MNTEKRSKFYELEFINGIIRKLEYRGRQGAIYNFKYDNLKKVKKLVDLSNGIYFVTKDDESMDIYIGQTTTGMLRFNAHKMKEYQDTAEIHFYSFEGQRPNKTLLDHIENKMIEMGNESKYHLLNNTNGNNSKLRGIDNQDAEENIPTMISLLKVFGIDFAPESDTTKEIQLSVSGIAKYEMKTDYEEDFFAKGDGYDFTISRKDDYWVLRKGSLVKAKDKWIETNGVVPTAGYFYEKFIGLVDDNNTLKKDVTWKSISPLVAFSKGITATPGWDGVKNKGGKTPHQAYREEE